MSAMKEHYNEHVYAADYVEENAAPDAYMDYLPAFPEDMKVGSLTLGRHGVMLRFSPEGYVLMMSEIPTPIKPLPN
jgi:hypothetical protein